jgi:hypothetical protein
MQRQLGDRKSSKEKMSLEIFKAVCKFMLKVRLTGRPAIKLVEREQFIYRIPVTHARLEGKSQCECSARTCAERSNRQTRKTVKH